MFPNQCLRRLDLRLDKSDTHCDWRRMELLGEGGVFSCGSKSCVGDEDPADVTGKNWSISVDATGRAEKTLVLMLMRMDKSDGVGGSGGCSVSYKQSAMTRGGAGQH